MRASIDVPLEITPDSPRTMIGAAYQAVADAVKIDDLLDLDVVAVEPATSVAKARTDAALRGAGHADITVTLQGSAHDVQELVRRYEEGVR
jgi:hypothetical protein